MTNRFLNLHALHAIPAANMNRGKDGSIKKINFNGTTRIRVSSQAWKRPMRVHQRATAIEGGAFALRTNRLPALVAEKVTASGRDGDAAVAKTAALFTTIGLKANEKNGNTKVQVFSSESAVDNLAELVDAHWDELGKTAGTVADTLAAKARAAFDVDNTIDLALYGRMLAEIPSGNVDSAVSAAHAFSVHAAAVEADFWSSVDDAAVEGEAAASNIGTAELASAILYRHIVLDRTTLANNLAHADNADTLTAHAQTSFVDAFIQALPTGHRSGTAATTLPAFVLAVDSKRNLSLADAFVNAIGGRTILDTATDRLAAHLDRAARFLPSSTTVTVLPVTADPETLPKQWTVVDTVDELVNR